jgi:hypothetical protein
MSDKERRRLVLMEQTARYPGAEVYYRALVRATGEIRIVQFPWSVGKQITNLMKEISLESIRDGGVEVEIVKEIRNGLPVYKVLPVFGSGKELSP